MANVTNLYEHGRTWLFGYTGKLSTEMYIGGTPSQYPDRVTYISPLTYASASAPKTFVIEPERDDFIPAQGNYDFVDAAKKAGVNISLVRIPFAHHSFDAFMGSLGDFAKRSIVMNYLNSQGLLK
jgi:acetyl esterase/lipase